MFPDNHPFCTLSKIDCIKLVRRLSNSGLVESKQAVEYIQSKSSVITPLEIAKMVNLAIGLREGDIYQDCNGVMNIKRELKLSDLD